MRPNATALAARLNLASPHARVESIAGRFPPKENDWERVKRCGIVLDCTGDDAILRQLELFPWGAEKLFISASVGFAASRLFCFAAVGTRFPREEYLDKVGPWIREEAGLYDEDELSREGAGCWHPVFPARIDDMWMMAAVAAKVLESVASSRPSDPLLTVFEQHENGGAFGGLRIAESSS